MIQLLNNINSILYYIPNAIYIYIAIVKNTIKQHLGRRHHRLVGVIRCNQIVPTSFKKCIFVATFYLFCLFCGEKASFAADKANKGSDNTKQQEHLYKKGSTKSSVQTIDTSNDASKAEVKVRRRDITKAKVELEKSVQHFNELNKKAQQKGSDSTLQKKLDEAEKEVKEAEQKLQKLESFYQNRKQSSHVRGEQASTSSREHQIEEKKKELQQAIMNELFLSQQQAQIQIQYTQGGEKDTQLESQLYALGEEIQASKAKAAELKKTIQLLGGKESSGSLVSSSVPTPPQSLLERIQSQDESIISGAGVKGTKDTGTKTSPSLPVLGPSPQGPPPDLSSTAAIPPAPPLPTTGPLATVTVSPGTQPSGPSPVSTSTSPIAGSSTSLEEKPFCQNVIKENEKLLGKLYQKYVTLEGKYKKQATPEIEQKMDEIYSKLMEMLVYLGSLKDQLSSMIQGTPAPSPVVTRPTSPITTQSPVGTTPNGTKSKPLVPPKLSAAELAKKIASVLGSTTQVSATTTTTSTSVTTQSPAGTTSSSTEDKAVTFVDKGTSKNSVKSKEGIRKKSFAELLLRNQELKESSESFQSLVEQQKQLSEAQKQNPDDRAIEAKLQDISDKVKEARKKVHSLEDETTGMSKQHKGVVHKTSEDSDDSDVDSDSEFQSAKSDFSSGESALSGASTTTTTTTVQSPSASTSTNPNVEEGDLFNDAKDKLEIFMKNRHQKKDDKPLPKLPRGPKQPTSRTFKEAQSKIDVFLKKEAAWNEPSLKGPIAPIKEPSEAFKQTQKVLESFVEERAKHTEPPTYVRQNSKYTPTPMPSSSQQQQQQSLKSYTEGRQKWLDLEKKIEEKLNTYTGFYGLYQLGGQTEELGNRLHRMYQEYEDMKTQQTALGQKLEKMVQDGLVITDVTDDTAPEDTPHTSSDDYDTAHSDIDEDGSDSDTAESDASDDDFGDDFGDDFDDDSDDVSDSDSDNDPGNESGNQADDESGNELNDEEWDSFILTNSGSGNPPGNMAPPPPPPPPPPGMPGGPLGDGSQGGASFINQVIQYLKSVTQTKKKNDTSTPPSGYNEAANQGSVRGLMQVIHGATQEAQSSMKMLALHTNTARLTPEKPFRMFTSMTGQANSQRTSEVSAQAGILFASPSLPKLWVGMAISHGRERIKDYQGIDMAKVYGGAIAKTATNQTSFITAWNIADPGPMAYVEGTFGWGEAKNTRVFTHAGKLTKTKGTAHTSTMGAAARLGYNVQVTPTTMVTPFVEVSSATAGWGSYSESGGALPAKISATKEHVIEHRAGLKGDWHISDVCKIQAWGAAISGKRTNGRGVTAVLKTPYAATHVSSGKEESKYKQLEVGGAIDFQLTHNCGVGVNAGIRTKDGKKDKGVKPQSLGVRFWYDF